MVATRVAASSGLGLTCFCHQEFAAFQLASWVRWQPSSVQVTRYWTPLSIRRHSHWGGPRHLIRNLRAIGGLQGAGDPLSIPVRYPKSSLNPDGYPKKCMRKRPENVHGEGWFILLYIVCGEDMLIGRPRDG